MGIQIYLTLDIILICMTINAINPAFGQSFEFNRGDTGVSFTPYVKTLLDKSTSCLNQYSFEELKTMLEVVSTKFTRVVTGSMDALDAEYIPNNTYYNRACIVTRTAEAAAVINRERNAQILFVIIGIKQYDNNEGGEAGTKTEVNLAIEAFHIANVIHPGTIGGFQFSNVLSNSQSAISGLRWMNYLRNQTVGTSLTMGIIASFADFKTMDLREDRIREFHKAIPENKEPMMNLIANSDFITCKFFADTTQAINSPAQNFAFSKTFLIIYKSLFEILNRNIATMGYSGWGSAGNYSFQSTKNLREYWIAMNEFATRNRFPMWFHEAFDNPWKTSMEHDSPYYGWWRLEENDNAENVSAYVENVLYPRNLTFLTPPTPPSEGINDSDRYMWVWSSVAVTVGVLVIMFLLVALLRLYKKKLSLQQFVLSKEEIRQFNLGLSEADIKIAQQGGEVCGSAMQKPYDRSLEVSMEKLEIYWDRILGAGQFGSVHKAVLKGDSEKEVALKTTKTGCPTNALRGLLSEIKILTHLGEHPNIVSICGAYTAELTKGKLYVALELCAMGSLKSHLIRLHEKKSENDLFCVKENLLQWSSEIAAGMEHIGQKGIVHADLATRNVLLTNEGVAKIADFGLSRRLYEYVQYVKKQEEPVPWKWMSVESLKMRQFSCQSDVWSFGVTLWEIFSLGTDPYPGYSYNANFVEKLEKGLIRMNRPSESTQEIYQVMQDCWRLQPEMRPTFSALRTRFLEISNEGNYKVLYDIETTA